MWAFPAFRTQGLRLRHLFGSMLLGRIHRKQAEGKQERLHPTDSRAQRWRPLQPLQQGTTFEIRSCKVHGSELGILTSALGLPKLSSEFPAPPNCKAARYNPFIRDPTPVISMLCPRGCRGGSLLCALATGQCFSLCRCNFILHLQPTRATTTGASHLHGCELSLIGVQRTSQ